VIALADLDAEAELELVRAELARRSFAQFVRRAWQEFDPAPLVWGWHLDALCDHLQAVAEGRIEQLLINVPPGHAKSNIVSVCWPAWRWIRQPSWRVLTASYGMDLATRDTVRTRTLISSPWYQTHFAGPAGWRLTDDQNVKSHYSNTLFGERMAISVGGKGTGFRGDGLIVDDPLNAADAHSKLKRDEAIRWFTETMSSRFNDLENASRVVIMQRLHEDDLSGYLLRAGGWEHLCLPSEFDPKRRSVTRARPRSAPRDAAPVEFWRDPREHEGDLLFPAKFPRKVLDDAKSAKGMGPIAYAGQHEQRPVPALGGILQRAWFGRRWHLPGESAPVRPEPVPGLVRREYDPRSSRPLARLLVTDAAFKKTSDSDRVAIGVADFVAPDLYLVDFAWRRMTFTETVGEIARMRTKWSTPRCVVGRIAVEDRANGPAVIEVLRQAVPGVIPIEPIGSKEARVSAAAAFIHSGNVWLPDSHPDLDSAIEESVGFPKASHDDWIDMVAYAILLTLGESAGLAHLERLCKWR
jgi:predicted phage terminase large subunit-like protein